MRKSIPVCLFLTLVSLFCMQCSRTPQSGEAAVGRYAPSFRLSDLRGKEVSLSDFQGKIVILDFWATWCGPCRMSMPLLEKLQKENPADVKLLAINLQETAEDVKNYLSRQNFQSTVLLDSDGEVGRVYRSESIPMQVLIDQKGVVRHIQIGFSPRLGEQLRSEIDKLRGN